VAVYAQGTILLGRSGPIEAGEEVPASFLNDPGEEEDTDFARLEELGLVGDKPPAEGEASDIEIDESANLEELTVAQLTALAAEREVDVEGTGSGGRVLKADLVTALSD
jgi:hypothetical protein